MLDLLVVHVPKTGGTALKKAMRKRFGDALLMVYADRGGELEGKAALIGHFQAKAYAGVAARQRFTVLRDPLDRALSEYFHFKSTPPKGNPRWRRIFAGELGPLDYIAEPDVRDTYAGYYFAETDMSQFSIVSQDRLKRDWPAVMASLGLSARYEEAQVRAEAFPAYDTERRALLDDSRFVAAANDLLAADRRFYERWTG